MALLVGLAWLALLIASVGVYGVLNYSVSQRIPEIGLRLTLGADRSQVMAAVLQEGCSIAIAGIAIGVLASAALSRLLSSVMYGVQPLDWQTVSIVSCTMLAAALLASYQPAARAAGLDPVAALRHE